MSDYMKDWLFRIAHSPERVRKKTAIVLLVSQDGFLDQTLKMSDTHPTASSATGLLYSECESVTTDEATQICNQLLSGNSIECRQLLQNVWHCTACGQETEDPEGPCSRCGCDLELFAEEGPYRADSGIQRLQRRGLKWSNLWKNSCVHNVLAHPASEILLLLGFSTLAIWVHNSTMFDGHGSRC